MQKSLSHRTGTEEDDIAILLHKIPDLNQFKVLKKIGHGTFSSVYLGESKQSRYYAIKHIIPTSHPSRVFMELKCLKLIGGKDNVIEAIHCFRKMNHIALVMPFIPHDTFTDYAGNLTLSEVGYYLYNLFLALKRIHSFNIIHRDIKPANFLYSRKYRRPWILRLYAAAWLWCTLIYQMTRQRAAIRFALVDFGLAQELAQSNKGATNGSINDAHSLVNGYANNLCHRKALPVPDGPQTSNKKVKRALSVSESSQANMNSCCKRSRLSGSISCSVSSADLLRRSPRKHLAISHLPCYKKEKAMQSYLNRKGSSINSVEVNDSPSKHTRLAEAIRYFSSTRSKGQNYQYSIDYLKSAQDNSCGASLTASRRSSTLEEVKTKSIQTMLHAPFSSFSSCSCYGRGCACVICLGRHNERAPRAGTPGFRAPEVLMRYSHQTTAIDMWSAGVILLSLLSGRYPFFRAVDDMTSLAEISTLIGTSVMKKTAAKLGKLFICSEEKATLDMQNVCEALLHKAFRTKMVSQLPFSEDTSPICQGCKQIGKECLCSGSKICIINPRSRDKLENYLYGPQVYYLLERLLDPNPFTRITAEEALKENFMKYYTPERMALDQTIFNHQW